MKLHISSSPSRLAVLIACALTVLISTPRVFARIDLSILQQDGFGEVDLQRPKPNVLTIPATINGQKMRLVVDTGALGEGIILNSDKLEALHVPTETGKHDATSATGKKLPLRLGHADKVQIGNVEIAGVPLIFNSMEGLKRSESLRNNGADGLLSAGFLRTCSGIIDLHNLRLYLRPPGKGHRVSLGPALHAAGLAEAPFEKCVVEVAMNDTTGKMILDTGAYHATADIDWAYKSGASVAGSLVGMQDVAGVREQTRIAHFKSFKIGGVAVNIPDLRLAKLTAIRSSGVVGFLGMDVLGMSGTIIDFGAQKLYFYPAQ